MFVILTTKPLNDGTKGFRFHFGIRINGKILGKKGFVRRRKLQSNGIKFTQGDCMNAYHIGKTTVYTEKSTNKTTARKFRHVAG